MTCTGRGFNSWFSVIEEVTYATDPGSARDSYGTLVSESLSADFAYEPSPGLGSRNISRLVQGPKTVGGDLAFEVNYEGVLGWLLKQTFGAYTNSPDTPGPGDESHFFDMDTENPLPTGLSMEVSKGNITPGNVILYTGSKISTFTLAFQSSGIVQGTVGLVCQDESPGVPAIDTPTFSTEHVLWSDFSTSSVTLAGVASASIPVQSGTFVVENSVEPRFLMDTLTVEPCMTARRRIGGTLVCEFPDLALLDEFHAGSQDQDFIIEWISAVTIPSGTVPFTMRIQATGSDSSLIMSNATNVGGEGPIIATIGYELFGGLLSIINGEASYGAGI